jgi:hypothetical protein
MENQEVIGALALDAVTPVFYLKIIIIESAPI